MMLAAQYTVLKDIHGGHRNWQEMFGVVLVILSSMMAALINTYCAGNTQGDTEDGASVLGEEGEGELGEGEEESVMRKEGYTSLDGQEEEDVMTHKDHASTSVHSSAQESNK